jgi:lysyl-tRNA synthetase class 2
MRHGLLPNGVAVASNRIHHEVFGVVMLIGSGYGWLHVTRFAPEYQQWWARLMTGLYGAGCALTLDELALLVKVDDIYWKRPWRQLIDAAILGSAFISIGFWGRRFIRSLASEAFAAT